MWKQIEAELRTSSRLSPETQSKVLRYLEPLALTKPLANLSWNNPQNLCKSPQLVVDSLKTYFAQDWTTMPNTVIAIEPITYFAPLIARNPKIDLDFLFKRIMDEWLDVHAADVGPTLLR
jgi:hypothetical protein